MTSAALSASSKTPDDAWLGYFPMLLVFVDGCLMFALVNTTGWQPIRADHDDSGWALWIGILLGILSFFVTLGMKRWTLKRFAQACSGRSWPAVSAA